jgi:hypothetical protein
MGRFIGVSDPSPPPQEKESIAEKQSSRISRPVAADFFGESSSTRDLKSDVGPWRRKQSHDFDRDPINSGPIPKSQSVAVTPTIIVEQPSDTTPSRPHAVSDVTVDPSTKEKPVNHDSQSVAGSSSGAPSLPNGEQVSRPTPAFREPPMSTLDDAMSRIKGMLDGMQQTAEESGQGVSGEVQVQPTAARPKVLPMPTAPKALPRESSWLRPPPRPRTQEFDQRTREIFDITIPELPRSPKPAWNTFVVRLPKFTRQLDPITKRQLHLHRNPPGQVRWDILSFNPPVEGMNRRDFSLNDVLFRKPPPTIKGKRRYVVSLPIANLLPREPFGPNGATSSKMRVPPSPALKANGIGAFGKPGGATDSSTWRKSSTPSTKLATAVADTGLDTVSCSPPPDLASNSGNTAPNKVEESARSRSQPKMPAGSAVAFYRNSRADSLESVQKSSVNFTVTSELEDAMQSTGSSKSQPVASSSLKVTSAITGADDRMTSVVCDLKSPPASPEFVPALVQSKSGSKSSEDSVRLSWPISS